MEARYGTIRGGHETADSIARRRPARRRRVRAALAEVRAEGAAASRRRAELEAERAERLAAVNAAIAERARPPPRPRRRPPRRRPANGRGSRGDVAAAPAELAVGRRPDDDPSAASPRRASAGGRAMNAIAPSSRRRRRGGQEHIDQTHHWFLPEGYEIWFGGIASIIIFGLLFWKAGPLRQEGDGGTAPHGSRTSSTPPTGRERGRGRSGRIRQAKGDIEAERARMLAEADAQAEALLATAAARLDAEVAELEAKADADIAAAGSRASTSCAPRSPGSRRQPPSTSSPDRSTTPPSSG